MFSASLIPRTPKTWYNAPQPWKLYFSPNTLAAAEVMGYVRDQLGPSKIAGQLHNVNI
jgi:hypothetical protein